MFTIGILLGSSGINQLTPIIKRPHGIVDLMPSPGHERWLVPLDFISFPLSLLIAHHYQAVVFDRSKWWALWIKLRLTHDQHLDPMMWLKSDSDLASSVGMNGWLAVRNWEAQHFQPAQKPGEKEAIECEASLCLNNERPSLFFGFPTGEKIEGGPSENGGDRLYKGGALGALGFSREKFDHQVSWIVMFNAEYD